MLKFNEFSVAVQFTTDIAQEFTSLCLPVFNQVEHNLTC